MVASTLHGPGVGTDSTGGRDGGWPVTIPKIVMGRSDLGPTILVVAVESRSSERKHKV